jgi:hypothetical protein
MLMPKTGRPHPVFLRNVSTAGACVQTDVQLRLGDDVRMRIDFEAGVRVTLDAIVIGVRPRPKQLYAEYGLKFLRVSAEAAAAIAAYVSRAQEGRPLHA